MKKLITILSLIIFISCSQEETLTTYCKTINSKESKVEWQHDNVYSTNYYFILDGIETKVTKQQYDNNNVGGKLCKTLDY